MRALIVAVVLAVVLPLASADASAFKDFRKAWQGRYQTYLAQRPALDAKAQTTARVAVAAWTAGQQDLSPALDPAFQAARELAILGGRGQLLSQFLEHFEGKPSLSLTELWLQERADALQTKIRMADEAEQRFRAQSESPSPGFNWIGELEALVMARGEIEGMAAELSLIDQNLRSYAAALGLEQERKARVAAALQAMGQSLSQQQQNTRNWTAHCFNSINGVTCHGN